MCQRFVRLALNDLQETQGIKPCARFKYEQCNVRNQRSIRMRPTGLFDDLDEHTPVYAVVESHAVQDSEFFHPFLVNAQGLKRL